MIASSAILHLARNGDISLTSDGFFVLIMIMIILLMISLGVLFRR